MGGDVEETGRGRGGVVFFALREDVSAVKPIIHFISWSRND
jgi:hypothetical protein